MGPLLHFCLPARWAWREGGRALPKCHPGSANRWHPSDPSTLTPVPLCRVACVGEPGAASPTGAQGGGSTWGAQSAPQAHGTHVTPRPVPSVPSHPGPALPAAFLGGDGWAQAWGSGGAEHCWVAAGKPLGAARCPMAPASPRAGAGDAPAEPHWSEGGSH